MLSRWTRVVLRLRWAVLALWLAVFVASAAAAMGLNALLTNRFVLPGSESEKVADILADNFGQKPDGSFSIVAEGGPGSARTLVPQVEAAALRAAEKLPTGRVAGVRPVGDNVVAATIVSELQPADAKAASLSA